MPLQGAVATRLAGDEIDFRQRSAGSFRDNTQ
jgi:hypothetical protein